MTGVTLKYEWFYIFLLLLHNKRAVVLTPSFIRIHGISHTK